MEQKKSTKITMPNLIQLYFNAANGNSFFSFIHLVAWSFNNNQLLSECQFSNRSHECMFQQCSHTHIRTHSELMINPSIISYYRMKFIYKCNLDRMLSDDDVLTHYYKHTNYRKHHHHHQAHMHIYARMLVCTYDKKVLEHK